ncbi:MAG: helix-turn-helix domain-containing protein [Ignavibacteria bacterium]|nr:helix-turn-helix domain-containing protein [Ignavibacteria bacterium]
MAKSKEKNKALKLRQKGKSIKEIAKELKIAKSTVSLWCRDIELTSEQIQKLHKQMKAGAYKGARIQYQRRLRKTKEFEKQGINEIGELSDRDFLLSGLGLYWGEGAKKRRWVKVNNSDPEIIKFILEWFRRILKVKPDRFTLRVSINKIHKDRIEELEEYWSKITGIPRKQFGTTTLIKVKNKKVYENFSTYYGTLTIEVRKSAELYYQIMGLIEGLIQRKIKKFKAGE